MTKLRTGSPEKVGMLPERVAHVRDLCARWIEEGHTPTLGVCVARRGTSGRPGRGGTNGSEGAATVTLELKLLDPAGDPDDARA